MESNVEADNPFSSGSSTAPPPPENYYYMGLGFMVPLLPYLYPYPE